jgi:hypothetical protein
MPFTSLGLPAIAEPLSYFLLVAQKAAAFDGYSRLQIFMNHGNYFHDTELSSDL